MPVTMKFRVVAIAMAATIAVGSAQQCEDVSPEFFAGYTCFHMVSYYATQGYTCDDENRYDGQNYDTLRNLCCQTCAAKTCDDSNAACPAAVDYFTNAGYFCNEVPLFAGGPPNVPSMYKNEWYQWYKGSLLDHCCWSCANGPAAQGPNGIGGDEKRYVDSLFNSLTSLLQNDEYESDHPYFWNLFARQYKTAVDNLANSCSDDECNASLDSAIAGLEAKTTEADACASTLEAAQEFIEGVDTYVAEVETAAAESVLESKAVQDKYLEMIHERDSTIAQLAQCESSATTCAGHCGTKNPSGACHCDMFCSDMGDCCNDYEDQCVGSCAGSCGGKSTSGECHCDADCTYFSDCCPDYASECGH